MSLPRFFYPSPLIADEVVELPREIANHAGRSLRLRDGDRIVLFSGWGGEFEAELFFDNGIAKARIETFYASNRLPHGNIGIAQALPSGDKMDWIIEKNSELGVTAIHPIKAERSILQLSGNRLQKRLQRWQAIANSSAEQCGRNLPLKVTDLSSLKQFLAQHHYDLLLVCHHENGTKLSDFLNHYRRSIKTDSLPTICLLIGPEGGWSDNELDLFAGYVNDHPTKLQRVIWGDRVFRTETAGLALASACLAILDWN
ncbi:Ribosomal RNA small subunit methyltransferase E [Oligella sp. MSHR50489EDL]|uniref:16S rRNA (uracil(1498)-N(3))-methyltransferase n=1 Tax=Oligella sp. MSHR50489EDL TaxID=3139409 RepID=UPI003D817E29